MAANVTFQIALYSPDLQTDILDLSVTNTLINATQGGMLREDIVPTSSTGVVIADKDAYADTSKLYVYNASTTTDAGSRIFISFDAGATAHLSIKGGEWALIPWTALGCPVVGDRLDIHAWSATADNTLEYGVFDV